MNWHIGNVDVVDNVVFTVLIGAAVAVTVLLNQIEFTVLLNLLFVRSVMWIQIL